MPWNQAGAYAKLDKSLTTIAAIATAVARASVWLTVAHPIYVNHWNASNSICCTRDTGRLTIASASAIITWTGPIEASGLSGVLAGVAIVVVVVGGAPVGSGRLNLVGCSVADWCIGVDLTVRLTPARDPCKGPRKT